jgi:hypothetical protein
LWIGSNVPSRDLIQRGERESWGEGKRGKGRMRGKEAVSIRLWPGSGSRLNPPALITCLADVFQRRKCSRSFVVTGVTVILSQRRSRHGAQDQSRPVLRGSRGPTVERSVPLDCRQPSAKQVLPHLTSTHSYLHTFTRHTFTRPQNPPSAPILC